MTMRSAEGLSTLDELLEEDGTLAAFQAIAIKEVSDWLREQGRECAFPVEKTFVLKEEKWDAFQTALDAPPRDLSNLTAAVAAKPVWDE